MTESTHQLIKRRLSDILQEYISSGRHLMTLKHISEREPAEELIKIEPWH
jgi:hypothetical protein